MMMMMMSGQHKGTGLILLMTLGLASPFLPVISAGKNMVKVTEKISKSGSLLKVLYPAGSGESEIPECERWSVCNRVDTYSRPWVERLCSCRNGQTCSTSPQPDDGHTIVDKTRQYKVCESADQLPTCRFFKDITWTHVTGGANNSKFQQRVHCKCPPNSSTYISGHDIRTRNGTNTYYYHFSCSPQSGMRCRRKEPCRLFTVRKRFPVEEVTTSTLCTCPQKTSCPTHHTNPFVLPDFSSSGSRDGTRTYSGFCGTSSP